MEHHLGSILGHPHPATNLIDSHIGIPHIDADIGTQMVMPQIGA